MIKVGCKLDNGATILAHKPSPARLGERTDLHIVLADTGEQSVERYVTWTCRAEDLSAYNGHYFTSISRATQDFEERFR